MMGTLISGSRMPMRMRAKIGGADLRDDRAHAVVRARAARRTDADVPLGEIVIVVENDHLVRGDFILCHELFDGAARGVHVRHGAGDDDLFAVHEGFGDGGFALLLLEFGVERFGGVPRCQKPMLWKVFSYFFSGLPSPTMRYICCSCLKKCPPPCGGGSECANSA